LPNTHISRDSFPFPLPPPLLLMEKDSCYDKEAVTDKKMLTDPLSSLFE